MGFFDKIDKALDGIFGGRRPGVTAPSCDVDGITTGIAGGTTTGVSTSITPAVIPLTAVTAAITADTAPAITPDLALEIATTVPSSQLITSWTTGARPFPARGIRPGCSLQIWPADKMPVNPPTAEQIARELYTALRGRCGGHWLVAQCIEDIIFPAVCRELGWPERSWKGKDGVAAHLAKLLPPPKYKPTEIDGEELKLRHYYIPPPEPAGENIVPLRRP